VEGKQPVRGEPTARAAAPSRRRITVLCILRGHLDSARPLCTVYAGVNVLKRVSYSALAARRASVPCELPDCGTSRLLTRRPPSYDPSLSRIYMNRAFYEELGLQAVRDHDLVMPSGENPPLRSSQGHSPRMSPLSRASTRT
jgi:hypothetical protein